MVYTLHILFLIPFLFDLTGFLLKINVYKKMFSVSLGARPINELNNQLTSYEIEFISGVLIETKAVVLIWSIN